MTLEFQTVWGELIVIYLFLGGLGGACLSLASIAVYSKRMLPIIAPWSGVTLGAAAETDSEGQEDSQPNRAFTLAMSLSGVVFLGVGTLMLLFDLLQPEAIIYLLSNPSSWIFWGTIFIGITLVCGALYGWAQAEPFFERWSERPSISRLSKPLRLLTDVGRTLQRGERWFGMLAGWFGFGTAFYTGFLVSMAPSIPFWHTPTLPLLFLVSAFSTGAAYALVVLVFVRRHQEGLEQRIEGFDVGLIIFELLLLLAYFNFASMGSLGVRASIDYLMSQPGFWLGALVLGLLVPLALEFWALFRHKKSPRLNTALSLLSGVLVLVGGYLLRHYVVYAGVFELPW